MNTKKSKIQCVTVVTYEGTSYCGVGYEGVHEILDYSCETESGMYTCYLANDKNGNRLRCIENCPVDVRYAPEEESGSAETAPNTSSFQFPKLAEVDRHLITQYGVLNNRERNLINEAYIFIVGNKKR